MSRAGCVNSIRFGWGANAKYWNWQPAVENPVGTTSPVHGFSWAVGAAPAIAEEDPVRAPKSPLV